MSNKQIPAQAGSTLSPDQVMFAQTLAAISTLLSNAQIIFPRLSLETATAERIARGLTILTELAALETARFWEDQAPGNPTDQNGNPRQSVNSQIIEIFGYRDNAGIGEVETISNENDH